MFVFLSCRLWPASFWTWHVWRISRIHDPPIYSIAYPVPNFSQYGIQSLVTLGWIGRGAFTAAWKPRVEGKPDKKTQWEKPIRRKPQLLLPYSFSASSRSHPPISHVRIQLTTPRKSNQRMTICTKSLSSSEFVRLANIEPFTLYYLDQSWVTSWKRVLRERCKRDEDDWDPRWWMGILKGRTLRIFLAIPDKQSLLGVYTGTAWRWRFRLCRQICA